MSIHEAMRIVRKKNRAARERRGKESEEKLDKALDLLSESGIISTYWIAYGDEDRKEGVDRHIQMPDGNVVQLQIKSSRTGVNIAKNDFPHIPAVEVIEDEKVEDLAKRTLGLLRAKLKGAS